MSKWDVTETDLALVYLSLQMRVWSSVRRDSANTVLFYAVSSEWVCEERITLNTLCYHMKYETQLERHRICKENLTIYVDGIYYQVRLY